VDLFNQKSQHRPDTSVLNYFTFNPFHPINMIPHLETSPLFVLIVENVRKDVALEIICYRRNILTEEYLSQNRHEKG